MKGFVCVFFIQHTQYNASIIVLRIVFQRTVWIKWHLRSVSSYTILFFANSIWRCLCLILYFTTNAHWAYGGKRGFIHSPRCLVVRACVCNIKIYGFQIVQRYLLIEMTFCIRIASSHMARLCIFQFETWETWKFFLVQQSENSAMFGTTN